MYTEESGFIMYIIGRKIMLFNVGRWGTSSTASLATLYDALNPVIPPSLKDVPYRDIRVYLPPPWIGRSNSSRFMMSLMITMVG